MYFLFEIEAEQRFTTCEPAFDEYYYEVVKCFNFIDHNVYLEKLISKNSEYIKSHPKSKTRIMKLEDI